VTWITELFGNGAITSMILSHFSANKLPIMTDNFVFRFISSFHWSIYLLENSSISLFISCVSFATFLLLFIYSF